MIDLHDLYVAEALQFVKDEVQNARSRGKEVVHFITGECFVKPMGCARHSRTNLGKGLHSDGGKAKIRPALEGHFTKYVRCFVTDSIN